ncbi:MAG: hypothetical protein HGB31_09290, partial [Erysipelotrichaceae bacterium]|nr:hypothetical protein [Erysipelotrichaceae bacterium]
VEIRATDILGNTQTLTTVIIIQNGSPLAQPLNWMIGLGILLLLILLLFGRRQVIFVFRGVDEKGKAFKVIKKRFAHHPKKDEVLQLKLPKIPEHTTDLEIIFTSAFTRSMRSRSTMITNQGSMFITFTVPKDEKDRFKTSVKL